MTARQDKGLALSTASHELSAPFHVASLRLFGSVVCDDARHAARDVELPYPDLPRRTTRDMQSEAVHGSPGTAVPISDGRRRPEVSRRLPQRWGRSLNESLIRSLGDRLALAPAVPGRAPCSRATGAGSGVRADLHDVERSAVTRMPFERTGAGPICGRVQPSRLTAEVACLPDCRGPAPRPIHGFVTPAPATPSRSVHSSRAAQPRAGCHVSARRAKLCRSSVASA